MAIFTMSASKATPGAAIDYITDKKKCEYFAEWRLDPSRSYADQMMETAAMWGKNQSEDDRKYYHFKISFAPSDWDRNGGKMTAADAFFFGMDFIKENFPNNESVLGVHTDRGHLHIHGIVNSVDLFNGKKLDIRNTKYKKIKDRVQEMCRERELTDIDWREATKIARMGEKQPAEYETLTFAEKGIRDRSGLPTIDDLEDMAMPDRKPQYGWKDELRVVIDYAATESKSMEDFLDILKEYGITTPRNTDNSISYLHPAQKKAVRGDKLGGAYTKASILGAFEYNKEKELQKESLTRQIGDAEQTERRRTGRLQRVQELEK